MSEKILFLTGKLAKRQLERILSSMKPEFSYQINQIGVNVAALMSESIIMRRLSKNQSFEDCFSLLRWKKWEGFSQRAYFFASS